jgi:hypothetical protein
VKETTMNTTPLTGKEERGNNPMKTEYAGIDYSHGMSNVNRETGIHYGIIPLRSVADWAMEEFEPFYGKPHCPECGTEIDADSMGCTAHGEIHPEDAYPDTPLSWTYEGDGYSLAMGEDSDIWVFKSPFTTHAQFCSPCAPGAGYLANPCDGGPLTYALGPDWYDEENPMPYSVNPI